MILQILAIISVIIVMRGIVLAGILTNKDKSAILTLAAKIACYIKKPSNINEYMLDIEAPTNNRNTPPPDPNDTSDDTRTDATPITTRTLSNEINLGDNKWFEKRGQATENLKKDLIDKLEKIGEQNLSLWGPWFSLLLIRLEKRSIDPFLNKVTALNSNLLKLYTSGEWEPLTVDSSGLSKYIEGFTGININDMSLVTAIKY